MILIMDVLNQNSYSLLWAEACPEHPLAADQDRKSGIKQKDFPREREMQKPKAVKDTDLSPFRTAHRILIPLNFFLLLFLFLLAKLHGCFPLLTLFAKLSEGVVKTPE